MRIHGLIELCEPCALAFCLLSFFPERLSVVDRANGNEAVEGGEIRGTTG